MSDDLQLLPALTIKRGATKAFRFTAVGPNGPSDLTNAQAWFSVKGRYEEAQVLIQKRSANAGGSTSQVVFQPQTGATLGKWDAICTPADTANLEPGNYVCDAWVKLSTGEFYCCAARLFIVEHVVTLKFPTT